MQETILKELMGGLTVICERLKYFTDTILGKGVDMKRFAFLLSVFILIGCATTDPATTETPTVNEKPVLSNEYIKIIDTQKNKDAVFDTTMGWMAKAFVSPHSVIQYSDKNSGLITGKARFDIEAASSSIFGEGYSSYSYIDYTLKIEIKDNKARLSFFVDDLMYKPSGKAYHASAKDPSADDYKAFRENSDRFIASLQGEIEKASADW
jgi:hypothetical protein